MANNGIAREGANAAVLVKFDADCRRAISGCNVWHARVTHVDLERTPVRLPDHDNAMTLGGARQQPLIAW
jgi:hypothetical protein